MDGGVSVAGRGAGGRGVERAAAHGVLRERHLGDDVLIVGNCKEREGCEAGC